MCRSASARSAGTSLLETYPGAAGLAMLSAGLVCAGLTILLFFGCMGAMKGILRLTKKITLWTKDRFIKKEDVQ